MKLKKKKKLAPGGAYFSVVGDAGDFDHKIHAPKKLAHCKRCGALLSPIFICTNVHCWHYQ